MGRERKLGKLWGRLKAGIVADVPPSLDACETCREVDCTEERWRTCPNRLEREAELLGALAGKAEGEGPGPEAPDRDAPGPASADLDREDTSPAEDLSPHGPQGSPSAAAKRRRKVQPGR